jgi:hypothetical protein
LAAAMEERLRGRPEPRGRLEGVDGAGEVAVVGRFSSGWEWLACVWAV